MIKNKYTMGGYPYRVGGPRRRIPAWASKKYVLGGVLGAMALGKKKGMGLPFRKGGYYQGGGMYGNPNAGNSLSGVQESRAADQQALSQYMGDSSWQNKFWNEQTQKQQMQQQMGQAATDALSSGVGALSGGTPQAGGGAGSSAIGGLASAAGDYMQMMGGDNDPTTITSKEKTGAMLSGAGGGAMQGAQMGSALGPMGALAGGVIGGVAGLIGGKKKQEKEQAAAKKQLGERNQAMVGAAQQMHARRMEGMEDMGSSGFRRGGMRYGMGGRMAYPMAKGGLQMGGFGPPMPLRSGGLSPMSYPANFSTGGGPANYSHGGHQHQFGGIRFLAGQAKDVYNRRKAGESWSDIGSSKAQGAEAAWNKYTPKIQKGLDYAAMTGIPGVSNVAGFGSAAIDLGDAGIAGLHGDWDKAGAEFLKAGTGAALSAIPGGKTVGGLTKAGMKVAGKNLAKGVVKSGVKTVAKAGAGELGSQIGGAAENTQLHANLFPQGELDVASNIPIKNLAETTVKPIGPTPSPKQISQNLGPGPKPGPMPNPQSTIPKIQHKAPPAPVMPPKGPVGPKKPAGPVNKPTPTTPTKSTGPSKTTPKTKLTAKTKTTGPSKTTTSKKPTITKKAAPGGGGGNKKPLIKPKLPLTKKPSGGGGGKGPLAGLSTKKPGGGGGGGKPKIKMPKIGGGSGGKVSILPKGGKGGGGGGLGLAKLKPKGGGGGGLKLPKLGGGGGGGGGGLAALKDKVAGKAQMGGFHGIGSRIMGSMRYDREFRQKQRDLDKEFSEKQKKARKQARADRKERRKVRKEGRQERRALRKSQRKDRRAARRGKFQDGGFSTAEHEYKMSKLNSLSDKLENYRQSREMQDMEDRILASQRVSKLQEGYRKGGPREDTKEFAMYAKMLNQLDEEQKDKAAGWMYVYDAKGRPVLPGQVPMITPGMIKKNLEKNQWLRRQYDAWREDKSGLSLKSLLPSMRPNQRKRNK